MAIGSAALFLFQGFNTGLLNEYRNNAIHAHYGNGQVNTRGYREKILARPWEAWIAEPQSVLDSLRNISGVSHVFPRLEVAGLISNGTRSLGARGMGIDGRSESSFFNTINVIHGKSLNDTPDGIVLGKGLAESMDLKVGDRVTLLANTVYGSLNGADLFVSGIFHTGSRELDDSFFQIQIEQAQQLLDTDKIEKISIGLAQHEDWPRVSQLIEQLPYVLEATPFEILDKIYYQNSVDFLNAIYSLVGFVIIFVVVLGVFNTSTSSILERTQEIGMLRANGESKRDIFALIACEGLIASVVGALIGIFAIVFLNALFLQDGFYMPPGPGITRSFKTFIALDVGMGFESLMLIVVAGVSGAVLAVLKVVRTSIALTLRHVG
jgi:putative ABC transport system permease protein